MTNSIPELEEADCILVTGSNTLEQHPLIARRILRAASKGARIILADPRRIPMARFAHIFLQQRLGTDVAWINGLMHVILREGLEDREFIKNRTEGFEELKRIVGEYTPERVEEITGIPEEDLIRAAKAYGSAERASIVYAMGITQHTNGVDNVMSLANLAMLTGNVGKPGTGVNPLRGQSNVQGACDMGALPNVYPGYQQVTDEGVRKKFEEAWGVPLPAHAGLTVTDMMEGKVKALYVVGENPMLADPDLTHVKKTLEGLEFLVVQDIFLTETAELAHVVLPASSFAEKDGTFTSTDRRIKRVRAAISPQGESKPDWIVIGMLGEAFGAKGFAFENPGRIMEEIARLTPIYGGVNYERLESPEGLQWPCPAPGHPGTPFLHKDKFSKGKGTFQAIPFKGPDERPDEDYPLWLTTGRVLFHFHTGSMTRRSSKLDKEVPTGYAEISPADAKRMGIRNGEKVRVSSRRGSIEIDSWVTDHVPEGLIFIPFHFRECAVNLLTNPAVDPRVKIPEYKVCAVRVEKIGEPFEADRP